MEDRIVLLVNSRDLANTLVRYFQRQEQFANITVWTENRAYGSVEIWINGTEEQAKDATELFNKYLGVA